VSNGCIDISERALAVAHSLQSEPFNMSIILHFGCKALCSLGDCLTASSKLLKPRIQKSKTFGDETVGDKVHSREGNSPD